MENAIKKSNLFKNLTPDETDEVIKKLSAGKKSLKKGEYVLRNGEKAQLFGIVLSGEVVIESVDYWGNSNVTAIVSEGGLFAEAYALSSGVMGKDVTAGTDSVILFFSAEKIYSESLPAAFMLNLIRELSEKNARINEKLSHMSKRTIRSKLISYFSAESRKAKSDEFILPFNRRRLADYLAVDRSALSAEMSKMKKEGLIDYDRNKIRLFKI